MIRTRLLTIVALPPLPVRLTRALSRLGACPSNDKHGACGSIDREARAGLLSWRAARSLLMIHIA